MFFIQVLNGSCVLERRAVETLPELAAIARKEFKRERANAFIVAVGADDGAVMPYVWCRCENDGTWKGEAGDSIKLGLKQNELAEHDPIEMLSLEEGVRRGIVTVYDDGPARVVDFGAPPWADDSSARPRDYEADAKTIAQELLNAARRQS